MCGLSSRLVFITAFYHLYCLSFCKTPGVYLRMFLFTSGHYCVGGVAVPCPAGTYGLKEGLQRLRDCTICPAGRVLIKPFFSFTSKDYNIYIHISMYTHNITLVTD